jgi:hypothetical protein
MTLATWDAALDLLDGEVTAVEEALAAGAPGLELADVVLPAHLGPIPAHLVERARAINARQVAAEASLTKATLRARQAMQLGDSSPAARPSLFDQRG